MKSKKGQDIVEWAIIIALVTVVAMAAMFMFVPNMINILNYASNAIGITTDQQQQ